MAPSTSSAPSRRTNKGSAKAGMRPKVSRLLTIDGYPPDLEEKALGLILEQAELLQS